MKSLILAATVAVLSVTVVAPLQAASSAPVLTVDTHGQIDRQGRKGCNSAHDRAERPGCVAR
jgi:hypothetical protein